MRVREYLSKWKGIGLITGITFIIALLAFGCTQQSNTTTPANTTSVPAQTTVITTTVTPTNIPSVSTGVISGKITNSLTKAAVSGAKVVTDPAIANQNITTDANGAYTATLPIGSYKLNATKDGYTAGTDSANLVAGQTVTKDFVLKPTKPVAVSAGAAQTAAPGATVTLKSTATPLDNSTIKSYQWTQVDGPAATLANDKTDTLTVTLPKASDYKAQLVNNLLIQDRFYVVGINDEALIGAQTTTFKVTVTTSSGTYSGTAAVTATLPYDISTGLTDVPTGIPVLLGGKGKGNFNWSVTGPSGSKAVIDDASSKNPAFIPDIAGKYTVVESVSKTSMDIYAGTWQGVITGQNAQGQPLAAGCTVCHDGKTAPDKFTPWMKSGHSVILTRNINDPAGHWSLACAGCHSVGYNTAVTNGGFDEAIAAEGWKAPAHGDPSNWTTMLAQDPKSAKLANIQCENCHGPNTTSLHANGTLDAARISLSADVCGSCHGEPPRHGLFQQWQESAHSTFDLAISEAGSASCARCHTAQGFMTWNEQGGKDLSKQLQGKNGNATAAELAAIVTADTAQPQTCTVCHDPHAQGVGTTNATVRISGDTPLLPAGFQATKVGKGAICITCHNTRNGLHNDSNPPTAYQAPHTPSQGDILMGQNAYFVNTQRSPHGLIQDTCVTCHMELSPPPAELSLNQTGANHTFAASLDICADCHSDKLNGEALQDATKAKLDTLATALTQYLSKKLPASFTILDYTPHTANNKTYDLASAPIVISKDNIASIALGEIHGQQGFLLNLKNAVTLTYNPANEQPHTASVKTVQFQLGGLTTDGKTTVFSFTDNIVKAGWNYYLIHGDGSEGIHNPAFINQVLDATLNALK